MAQRIPRRRFLQRCLVAGRNLYAVELEIDGAIYDPHTLTVLVMVADSDTPVTAEQLEQRYGPRKKKPKELALSNDFGLPSGGRLATSAPDVLPLWGAE